MVKCVVSSCLNRRDRGLSRTPKRFFSFPKDPVRIKVWLAALREPDKQHQAENHVICEDHFLPEDISESGVSPDAIPIMPPCLEEELGIDAWPEDPEEDGGWAMEDVHEEEEEYYEDTNEDEQAEEEADEEAGEESNEVNDKENEDAAVDCGKGEEQEETATETTQTVTEGDTDVADGVTAPPAGRATAPPADEPTTPPADGHTEPAADALTTSSAPAPPSQLLTSPQEQTTTLREDLRLHSLTRPFLELLLNSDGSLDVREAAKTLAMPKRRVYDITSILMGADLMQKESVNRVRWTGKCPISSFLWEKQKMQQEAEKLKQVEDTLDGLIKSCAQQLFSMTDDRSNADAAFVTFADVQSLPAFQDQTVIVVKAPAETKLEVPAPKRDSIQIHLKSGSGPISVLACGPWPDVTGMVPPTFLQIQQSPIKTRPLRTESSSQSTVLSL